MNDLDLSKFKRKLLCVAIAACFSVARANPVGPTVVAGQASFQQQGNVFSITNTPNTILNWQSFSIQPHEITRFIQQTADSKVLNRITGQNPSQILGALQSNGKVFLINPNGVVFGKDARVDVQGLVASSLALSDADFLAGRQRFAAGSGGAGKVENQGSINTAAGGQVLLLGSSVGNSGVITSPQGEVILAAGHSVQLVDAADPALQVVVSAPADQALNLGQVVAAGGKVGIYGALVNQRGRVSADSAVRGANGKIVLKASRETLLEQGSVTSAGNSAGQGGAIELLGERVGLTGNAQVDASGAAGGGQVLLGGGYQGKDAAVPNAQQTHLGAQAVVRADALEQGDGGRIIAWGNDATRVYGRLSARGGARGGNGGFIETSGGYLDMRGQADLFAPAGKGGTLLLDPTDLRIVASASDYLGGDGGLFADITNALSSNILAGTLTALLDLGTNVEVRTANVLGTGTGTLSVQAPLSWSGNAALTLTADDNMVLNAAITASHSGAGLVMKAGGDIAQSSDAAISVASVTATSSGGAIRLGAQDNNINTLSLTAKNGINAVTGNSATDVSKASSSAGSISLSSSGALTLSGPVEATQGSVSVFGAQRIQVSGSGITASRDGYIDLSLSSGGTLDIAGSATLASNGSNIDISTDKLTLDGTIEAGAGRISVSARTTSQPVHLGSSSAEALSLTADALSRMHTSGELSITSGTALTMGGDIDLTTGATTPSLLTLNAGGDITLNGALKVGGSLQLSTERSGLARITHGPSASTTVGGELRMLMGQLTLGGTVSAGAIDIQSGNSITVGSGSESSSMMALTPAALTGALRTDSLSLTALAGESAGTSPDITLNQALNWGADLKLSAAGRLDVTADLALGGGLTLGGGTWVQNSASLPALTAYDFRIDGASFLRVQGGDGSAGAPYLLGDVFGLQGMTTLDHTAHYRLAGHIDASGSANWNAGNGFVPIGSSTGLAFSGVFDGNNKAITGLAISSREANDVGLFGRLGGAASISNLTLSGTVTGGASTGALAGYAESAQVRISNVHSSASVFGYGSAGGLIGVSYAQLADSSASGAVQARTSGDGVASAGGLVAHNMGSIGTSSASGSVSAVTASGAAFAGGLAGINDANVSASHASGAVTASGSTDGGAGGLVGQNAAAVHTSSATGVVSSGGRRVGGLVGHNKDGGAAVSASYATGAVDGGGQVGGLVGFNEGSVADAYATGTVSGNTTSAVEHGAVGGFAGANSGSIARSFSHGAVSGNGFTDVKGFAGSNSGSVASAYWNMSAAPGLADASATGRTEQEMMQQSSFGGFAFTDAPVWRIYDGHTLPMLKSMLVALDVTVSGNNQTHVYDGSTPGFSGSASYAGFTGGDTVAALGGTLGWGSAVNAGSYSPDGLYSTKYDISILGGPLLTIERRQVTLGASKEYDRSTAVASGQLVFNNLVAGDSLGYSGSVAFADKQAGSGKVLLVGQGALEGAKAGNYTLNTTGATGVITPAQLSVSGLLAPDRAYNGQLLATTTGGVLAGILSGDEVTLGAVSAAFDSAAPGSHKAVTVSSIALAGSDAANYRVSMPTGMTASVTQAPLATWIGAGSGVWSDSANWAGGVVPLNDYVLAAVLGGTSGSVTLDGGNVTLKTLTAANGQTLLVHGNLKLGTAASDASLVAAGVALGASGTLQLDGTLTSGSYTQAGNALTSGSGALLTQHFSMAGGTLGGLSSLVVSSGFSQAGGAIALPGAVALTQATGNLLVGGITAGNIALRATGGAILQTGALNATSLSVAALGEVRLNHVGNHVLAFSGSGAGISLNNALTGDEQLGLGTLSASSGHLAVDNIGGIYTEGVLSAPGGKVSLTAHSPITVHNAIRADSIALEASTDITLGSGAVLQANKTIDLKAGTSVQLGGSVANSAGNISATAGAGNISASSGTTVNNAGQVLLTASQGTVSTTGLTLTNGLPVVTDLASLDAAAKAAAEAAAKAAAEAAAKKAAEEAAAKAAAEAAAKAAEEAAAKAAAEAAAKAAAEAAAKKAAEEAAAKAAAEAAAKKAAEEAAAKAAAEAAAKKAAEEAAAKAAAEAAAKKAAEEAAAKAAAEAAAKAAAEAAAKAAAEAAAKAAAEAAAKAAAEAAAKAAAEAAAKKAAEEAAAKAAAEAQNRPGEPVSQAINTTVNIINAAVPVSGGAPLPASTVAAPTATTEEGKTAAEKTEEKQVKEADPAGKGSIAKESVKKMYCN
jgi:filamentous hemagglutinin family protein